MLGLRVLAVAAAAFARCANAAWEVECPVFANAWMDPIVSPKQRSSHMHSIAGSLGFADTINATRLAAAKTSCTFLGDASAYWAPAMYYTKTSPPTLLKAEIHVYYRFDKNKLYEYNPANLATKPLRMVLGAPDTPPSSKIGFVSFTNGVLTKVSKFWRSFGENVSDVAVSYMFPECWNGGNYQASQAHMAYLNQVTGSCPKSHPKRIPTINFVVNYALKTPVSWSGGAPFRFSKSVYPHADAVLLWNPKDLQTLFHNCQAPDPQLCGQSVVPRQSQAAARTLALHGYNVPKRYQ